MTDDLAERLLVKVLNWGADEVRENLPVIQALAMWKYDSYERFDHGRRFVESLALWLEQFKTIGERRTAFEFVRRQLVFVSEAEMTRLVEMVYPDYVRPYLLERIAREANQPLRRPLELARQTQFLMRQRQCLFLGLSDGACTDVFRRSNSPELTHEQILLSSEINVERATKLLSELAKGLEQINGSPFPVAEAKFRTVVLLDDFSGSGLSYLRIEEGKPSGKIARFTRNLFESGGSIPTANLIDKSKLEILVILYTGTDQAYQHLRGEMAKLQQLFGISFEVRFIHQFDGSFCMRPSPENPMAGMIEQYYDSDIETQHTGVGGSDVKYGFAKCGLPLVLPHNTPNNSIALLWAETEKVRALFPRVQRHRRQA